MGGYSYPLQAPDRGPYTPGFGPYSQNSTGSQLSSLGGPNFSGPYVDVNPNASMEDIYASNRNVINTTGNVIGGEAGSQLGYYGPLQQQYQGATANALNQLGQTPGYNAQESAPIGADYSQFNTSPDAFNQQFLSQGEQRGIAGDPNAPLGAVNSGLNAEGAFLNEYQGNLGAQLGQYGSNLGSAADQFKSGVGGAASDLSQGVEGSLGQYGKGVQGALSGAQSGVRGAISGAQSGVRGAVGDLSSGLNAAQSKFSGLDQAVNDPSLQFDPNSTEKQLTDRDVQDIRTQAGTSVGNQFRGAEDTLERQAAQAGNTSPAALAAMRQALVTQEAATAGDAESNAQINALQAQYQRAAGIEGQRLGASQTQQGMRATASTTEEAAAQAAAGLAGQAGLQGEQFLGQQGLQGEQFLGSAGLQGAEALGQAGLSGRLAAGSANLGAQEAIGTNLTNAVNNAGQANIQGVQNFGQFSTGQANTMTGQAYGAQSTAEQLAAQRAAALATNRQATQTGVNQAQYAQGTGSQQLTSQGQKTLGDARIAGQNTYLSGVANQGAQAQQGGQAAQQTQLGAYGTQTSGLNSNAAGQGNFEVGKPSLGDQLGKSLAGLFEKGGVATKPTLAKLGERGPEMVVPLGPYRSNRQFQEAA